MFPYLAQLFGSSAFCHAKMKTSRTPQYVVSSLLISSTVLYLYETKNSTTLAYSVFGRRASVVGAVPERHLG